MSTNAYRQAIEVPSDRLIVALDGMNWEQAEGVMQEVGPYVGMAKANSIANKYGWKHAVETIADLGAFTMADPKFNDIPATMRLHLQEVTDVGPALITVHASNSTAALRAAVEGRDQALDAMVNPFLRAAKRRLGGVLGITVLTSIGDDECVSIYGEAPEKKVITFAHNALDAGLDGIVCSAKELKAIRKISALDSLITVVPGITPEWATPPGDQKRIATPSQAIGDGADFLVVGRAITQPPEGISRAEAAQRIAAEIKEAL